MSQEEACRWEGEREEVETTWNEETQECVKPWDACWNQEGNWQWNWDEKYCMDRDQQDAWEEQQCKNNDHDECITTW